MITLILFWLCLLFFIYRQIRNTKEIHNSRDRLIIIYLQPILLLGILIRTVYLAYPFGVFCDEAINGYDTWCLAHYGVDQHLTPYPVYLESWGTGQSALYAYLALPFIKFFGLSTATHRIPMALISSLSVLFLYWTLLKTQRNTLLTFVITTFVIISPWHIMKSRWALDCNICPDLVLISICFFILAYYTVKSRKQTILYILGFVCLSASAYAYGISWFMLPIFTVALILYFLKKKRITIKQLLLSSLIMLLLLIPIILFAFNLFFDGEEFQIGPLTIINMEGKRHESTTLLGETSFFGGIYNQAIISSKFLLTGSDALLWNSIKPWGQFYNLLGIPFIIYYFVVNIWRKKFEPIDFFFIIWFIACIPILFLVSPNVNHWNLIWFPLLFFCGSGIYIFVSRFKKAIYVIVPIFTTCFLLFISSYFDLYSPQNKGKLWQYDGFNFKLEEPVKFVREKKFEKVYFSGDYFSAWDNDATIVLFHNPVSPQELVRKKISHSQGKLDLVESFNNNYFQLPEQITPQPNTAYVISEDILNDLEIDYSLFNRQEFDYYIVLWNE